MQATGTALTPEMVSVISILRSFVESELTNGLEPKSIILSDMGERWASDEEELFFEVIHDEAV